MRVYFCTDIHGSERCWRKFLAAPAFYGADVAIIGGDITGKFVVPIVRQTNGTYTGVHHGVERRVSGEEELARLERMIADSGSYSWVTTAEERDHFGADQARVDALFRRLVMERLERWISMAEDKLGRAGVRVMVSGGNDDYFEVDDALARSSLIEDPNGKVIDLPDRMQIIGMGYGNPTPWPCPRDISEEELGKRIMAVADRVADPARTIFNLHVPPRDSELDLAPRLDENLQMVIGPTGPEIIPVGSTAVRDALLRYRPLVGLHGHIHESKGVRRLDGVTVVNPGSEYGEGILDGALLDISERNGVERVELVSG